jgi:hypothetical protein
MRRLTRCTLVWLLALAFAASGIAGRPCAASQQAPAAVGIAHPAHSDAGQHSHFAGHENLHRQVIGHQHTAADPAEKPANNHDCGKCCSLCTVAGTAQGTEQSILIFSVSAVSFSLPAQYHRDRTIDPDPEIPKLLS